MKFNDAYKWHGAELTVTECAIVFSSTSGRWVEVSLVPPLLNSDQSPHHNLNLYSS